MAVHLADYNRKARNAVKAFWVKREAAKKKQLSTGKADQGERSGVTAGKNMNDFINLIIDVVRLNGLTQADIYQNRSVVTLPGFFRPTKQWDLLVMFKGTLVAALELKSQVGPSFGNNCNNRTEEAIGTAHDFWIAYREGAFGQQPQPFVGWFMLVEDAVESRSPISDRSPHFQILHEFKGASYLQRYDLLCQKLIKEQLYTSASVIASPRSAIESGEFVDLSPMTSLKAFVTSLAGHISAEAARLSD